MMMHGQAVRASLCLAMETQKNPENAKVTALMLETIAEWLRRDEHAGELLKTYQETLEVQGKTPAEALAGIVMCGMLAGLTVGVQAQIDSVQMHDQPPAAAEELVH